jgi:hypothetical protein
LGVLAVVALLVALAQSLNYTSQKVHKQAGVPQLHSFPTSERVLALELQHLQFLVVGGLRLPPHPPQASGLGVVGHQP